MSITRTVHMDVGDRVGRTFEITGRLGRGGLGEVFLARDIELGRQVAIKTLRASLRGRRDQLERLESLFRRDAAATARLNHPNIVTLFTFGEHDGVPFMVLEYIEGTPLDALLRERVRLERSEALRLGRQLARALAYAHSRGIVHRDIKPANLMLAKDGRLKVLDFGVALIRRALEDQLGTPFTMDAPRRAGTPAYMSPEQMAGGEQDARSDAWAFGVTLYELLFGERPHRGAEALDPSFVPRWPEDTLDTSPAPALSRRVKDIITACIAHDSSARPTSFEEIERALRPEPAEQHPDTSSVFRGYVPRRANTYVPREEATLAIVRALDDPRVHVVSLVGGPGVGKTRLSTEWARTSGRELHWCPLMEARDEDDIVRIVGDALAVPLAGRDPAQRIGWALAMRPGPIVLLDNCEHVLDALIPLVTRWTQVADSARFLTTSREALELSTEQVIRLGAMSTISSARTLFVARAEEASPGWSCPPEQSDALDELLEQLDLLPLAIELAAARAPFLTPDRMLGRMSERFKLLRTSRRRAGTSNQAALETSISWSWELLGDAERTTLAQATVFEGSFTVDDAEAVIDLSGMPETSVLDTLERLVASSMLHITQEPGRFTMWVSVRAFASGILAESPDHQATRRRHLRHLARLGDEGFLRGAEGRGFRQVRAHLDELRAAIEFGLEAAERSSDDVRDALRCLIARAAVIGSTGPFVMGESSIERAGAHIEEHPALAHRLLGHAARAAFGRWDLPRSEELLLKALDGARGLGDTRNEARWMGMLGIAVRNQGRSEEAQQYYEASLALAESNGDQDLACARLTNLGLMALEQGCVEDAERLGSRAVALARAIGDIYLEGIAIGELGRVSRRVHQHELADARFERGLEIARALENTRLIGLRLANLAYGARMRGDLERARALLLESLDVSERAGDWHFAHDRERRLGVNAIMRGELFEARERLHRSLRLAREVGARRDEGMCVGYLARVAQLEGDATSAEDGFRAALEIARAIQDPEGIAEWSVHLGHLAVSRGSLGEAAMCFEEGATAAHLRHLDDQECSARIGLVKVLIELGERERAQASIERALELALSLGDIRHEEAETLQMLLDVA